MWDPDQYLRYADQRARPFFDLVHALGDIAPRTVADLGCGPGGLTATLLDRWPEARIWGVDHSPAMIEHAARRAVPGRLDFVAGGISEWQAPAALDLILSNACFHWVADHARLLDHLVPQLAEHATLAFQVPNNFTEPSHVLLRQLVESDHWAHRLAGLPRPGVEEPSWYVRNLTTRGLRVDAWETTYLQVLDGPGDVLEWVKGSTLRPLLDVLDRDDQERFLAEYEERLAGAYRREASGTIFPFKRIFVVARRREAATADHRGR